MSEEATLDEFVNEESNPDTSKEDLMTSLDETSVGNIPPEWSAVRLSELTESTLYGANESAEDYDRDKPRYIRIKDIDQQGRLKESEKASLSTDKAEGYLLEEGDMLFARSGSPGRTYLHRYDEKKYCYGGYSIKHELVSEDLNHEYLSQYTKSQKYWDWIERIARTGAQANINSGEYASLLVPLPELPEQRKIATVLYTVDQAIQKTEEILEQTHVVKNGLMQDVFHGRHNDFEDYQPTPVGEIPSHWSVASIGDVVHTAQYGISESMSEEGQYPIFRMNNIENGYMVDKPLKYIDLDDERFQKYRVKEGDILFNRTNSLELVGKTGIYELEGDHVFASYLVRLQTNDKADSYYLNYYMNSSEAQNRMMDFATKGVSQANINANSIQQVKLPLPPIEEQKEITERINSIDSQIEISQQYKSQLKSLKLGLMQDLLSGAVRTTDTNIQVPEEVAQHG